MPNAETQILTLKGLSKVYPGTVARQDVDLELERGETRGIVGKNGVGKTTLVGIVAGLIQASAGTVQINGHDYNCLTRIGARKARVAIVSQEPQRVQQATVAENLFLPDFLRHANGLLVDCKSMYERAGELLRRGRFERGCAHARRRSRHRVAGDSADGESCLRRAG